LNLDMCVHGIKWNEGSIKTRFDVSNRSLVFFVYVTVNLKMSSITSQKKRAVSVHWCF